MNIYKVIILLFATMLLAACDSEGVDESALPADKVFYAKNIYTVDDGNPFADAVAVRDGRIVYVGSRFGVAEFIGGDTDVVDLDGATMFPGFTDGHAHLLGIGNRELSLNLEGASSISEVQARVAKAVGEAKVGAWVYGRGWIETHWPQARFLTKQDIDAISPNNPVVLTRADGHALVANSLALSLAGVDKNTKAGEGGAIHYSDDGEPNGLLIDRAQNLVLKVLEENISRESDALFVKAGEVYSASGWTGIHNMSVDPSDVGLIEGLSDSGMLPIRVYNSIDLVSGGVTNDRAVKRLMTEGPRVSRNGKVITRAIKVYLDGALGSRGAALLEPYSDASETDGLMLAEKEKLMPILVEALRSGIQINAHAIGDRGNRELLNWFSHAFNLVPKEERTIADPRWRDEHTQIVNPSDLSRFVQLGVIPSMQASHAIGDMFFAPDRLGVDRLHGAYAWQSLLDTGSFIVGGSDAPVERGDPRIEFYAAVARMWLDGFHDENWHREEAVSREDALKMFTIWPAYASFQENNLGSIEVGKLADFTVFSDDIMSIPFQEILKVKTVMTVVGGEIIYKAD